MPVVGPYLALGDTAAAVTRLAAFVDLWENAEPSLQPRLLLRERSSPSWWASPAVRHSVTRTTGMFGNERRDSSPPGLSELTESNVAS